MAEWMRKMALKMQSEKLQSENESSLAQEVKFFLGLIENILNICVFEVRMKINVFKFGGSQLLSP